jgi:flavin-dependent dehydrogenase
MNIITKIRERKDYTGKNVLVLGAGIGGLYAARALADNGFNVTVLEKKNRGSLGYPWRDSVKTRTFSSIGLELPEGVCVPKQILKIIGPDGEGEVSQPYRMKKCLDVDRRGLIDFLLDRAEEKCGVIYGVSASELIVSDGFVRGAVADGKEYAADLTVDACGVFSKFRAQTPENFFIDGKLSPTDYLAGYRGYYYKKRDVAFEPRTYLMPFGMQGISWCKDAEKENYADVFFGHLGHLDAELFRANMDFLKKHNPSLSEAEVFGQTDAIPVRRPLGVFVGNGYALVGNSACMTRPLSGSGIETSLKAGRMLANTVIKTGSDKCTAENLWRYERAFNSKYGSDFFMQDIIRNKLQSMPKDDLGWVFTSGILNENVVALVTADPKHISDFKLDDISSVTALAKSRKDLVKSMEETLKVAAYGKFLTLSSPRRYNPDAVAKWKEKYDGYYGRQ